MRHVFLLALLSATGCTSFHYVAREQSAGCAEGAEKNLSSTRFAVWIFKKDELNAGHVPDSCKTDPCHFECFPCHGNGFADVKVETNFAFSLLSVLTLGVVSPLQVSYTCSSPD